MGPGDAIQPKETCLDLLRRRVDLQGTSGDRDAAGGVARRQIVECRALDNFEVSSVQGIPERCSPILVFEIESEATHVSVGQVLDFIWAWSRWQLADHVPTVDAPT